MQKSYKIFKTSINILLIVLIFFTNNISAFAFDSSVPINIYSSSDTETRSQINVISVRNTNYINFFVDQYTWNKLSASDQYKISNFAALLASEFEYKIYPKIISVLPNITNWLNFQKKLNVVFTPMANGIQGYIRWDDFNNISQSKTSNEGNIIYLNSKNLFNTSFSNNVLYSFFIHEFMHLISFREKTVKYNVEEDTWLEELRSEYLSHFLGYNQTDDSYLNFRLQNGLSLTDVNLTNWNNTNNSYALINLFGIYLSQRFTSDIIFKTLTSKESGVESINHFLTEYNYKEKFSDIYQDWIIANILNSCSFNQNYCYKNLDVRINTPGASFFLPLNSNSTMSISDSLKSYQTKYQKIVGGSNNLEITLENTSDNIFQKIPYILITKDGKKILKFFEFNNETIKKVNISDYLNQYSNIIIITMFASNNSGATQLFKWHINSGDGLITTSTVKPIVRTTTSTSKEENQETTTSTSKPDFGNSSPIVINVVSPVEKVSFISKFLMFFQTLFQKIFSKS